MLTKQTAGFRFSPEALSRLGELAKEWSCTRTEVLERLILRVDPEFYARARNVGKTAALETVQEVLETVPKKSAPKSAVPGEVRRAEGKNVPPISEEDRAKLKRTIPKPDWKR